MDKWLESAVNRKVVERLERPFDLQKLFLVNWMEHPWYDEGVVFDWEPIHRKLRSVTSTWQLPNSSSAMTMRDGDLITTIDVRCPWEICRLNDAAANMSCFTSHEDRAGNDKIYRFVRGAAGQMSTRDDAARALESAVAQLRGSDVDCFVFFSTIVVRGQDFESLLRLTGTAYRALKQAGLNVSAATSNLEPRRAVTYGSGRWSTMSYASLSQQHDGEQLVIRFVADAFFQWLDDAHIWFCRPAITPTLEQVKSKVQLFLSIVATERVVLGFDDSVISASGEWTQEFLESLASLACVRKSRPATCTWSTLEIRVFLELIGAYRQLP